MSDKTWNYDWITQIKSEMTLYPIQFANVRRIEENDAIFIFDEVGSGKTICSGLMAFHYLNNNSNENVRVITINSLAGNDGQFLSDWKEKFPTKDLLGNSYYDRISSTNNHCAYLKNEQEIGLLIIDEAHLFLNEETSRYKYLTQNIRAKKIIFLTATPIKNSIEDLRVYQNIASKVLGKPVSKQLIDCLSLKEGKNANDLICCSFDERAPVTRYFKDTMFALQEKNGKAVYERKKAMRQVPEIWSFSYNGSLENKNKCLAENIAKIRNSADQDSSNALPSRFVVFTRLVDKNFPDSSYALEEYLKKYFPHLNIQVITGDNRSILRDIQLKRIDCPDILIMTYTIAEQGVNLPEFNYVINYHIPAYPSSLEQRFGRVDRKTSEYDEIHMVYLLGDGLGTSEMNFYNAMSVYKYDLVPNMPVKNCLLNREILSQIEEKQEDLIKHLENIEKILENKSDIVRDYILNNGASSLNTVSDIASSLEYIKEALSEKCFDFADINSEIEALTRDIKQRIAKLSKKPASSAFDDFISKSGDSIFYYDQDTGTTLNISPSSALEGDNTAAGIIAESEKYKDYCGWFEENIKLLSDFRAKYAEGVNQIIEDLIMKGTFPFIDNIVNNPNFYKSIANDFLKKHAYMTLSLPACRTVTRAVQYWNNIDIPDVRISKDYFSLCLEYIKGMNMTGCSEEFIDFLYRQTPKDIWIKREQTSDGTVLWTSSIWYKIIYSYGKFAKVNINTKKYISDGLILKNFILNVQNKTKEQANDLMNPLRYKPYGNRYEKWFYDELDNSKFDDNITKKIFESFLPY